MKFKNITALLNICKCMHLHEKIQKNYFEFLNANLGGNRCYGKSYVFLQQKKQPELYVYFY